MRRWRVYKDSEIWSRQWVAAPAHENWWERPQGRRFPQWYMAMAYAAREAQQSPKTITIEDPTGGVCDLTVTLNFLNHIHLTSSADSFTLAPHEWKPLAHFLLEAASNQEEA